MLLGPTVPTGKLCVGHLGQESTRPRWVYVWKAVALRKPVSFRLKKSVV